MSMTSTIIPTAVDPTFLSPSGSITMFHGLIANIPAGWVICDGANSTPDLRGRFIQGAADGVEAGATGGSSTATPAAHSSHTVTQPNAHTVTQPGGHSGHSGHSVTQPSAHSSHSALGTHQHRSGVAGNTARITYTPAGVYGVGGSASTTHASSGGSNNENEDQFLTEAISGGTPSGHSAHSGTAVNGHSGHSAHSGTAVDSHGGTAVNAHSEHSTADSRPPFFILLYIMKT